MLNLDIILKVLLENMQFDFRQKTPNGNGFLRIVTNRGTLVSSNKTVADHPHTTCIPANENALIHAIEEVPTDSRRNVAQILNI